MTGQCQHADGQPHSPINRCAECEKIANVAQTHGGKVRLRSVSFAVEPNAQVRAIVENAFVIMMINTGHSTVISDRPHLITSTNALARGLHGGSAFGDAIRWLIAGTSILAMMRWLTGFLDAPAQEACETDIVA